MELQRYWPRDSQGLLKKWLHFWLFLFLVAYLVSDCNACSNFAFYILSLIRSLLYPLNICTFGWQERWFWQEICNQHILCVSLCTSKFLFMNWKVHMIFRYTYIVWLKILKVKLLHFLIKYLWWKHATPIK